MLYFTLKVLHIVGATLFFGTGLASAWYKWRADRSGDVRIIAWAQREIVRADWMFTVPSGLIMPATGVAMVMMTDMPWHSPIVEWGLGGYGLAGGLWLYAAWLQLRMRKLADRALAEGTELPAQFRRDARVWLALGVPAFLAVLVVLFVMVTRQSPL